MISKTAKLLKLFSHNSSFCFSESRMASKREGEVKLVTKIKQALKPSYIKVVDITIGPNSCGQMYNITVESEEFKGKSLVQQHQMVTNSISQELKSIHGYNLKTKAPEQKSANNEEQNTNEPKEAAQKSTG